MDRRKADITHRDMGETSPPHAADDARGGEIILRTRRRRLIFIGGLAAWGLIAFLALFAR
jgi:hypothetical protein